MSDTLIRVENVSKKFCRDLKRSLWYGLKDLGSELLGRERGVDEELRPDEFWAVKDVSFELKRGECLGLIGPNGAGKTTLLRTLNGLIKPDCGQIAMRGGVGALIALGAGFNPVLTGRENIYVNGAILGLSRKDTERKISAIIEFSELGDFIDSPVQTYSSGMHVKLGFAVAAILLEPDILFLDEILAVGDIGFTIKCLNFVRQMTSKAAVVFVSHNMQYVSVFCNRVMLLDHGQLLLDTMNPSEGIDHYLGMIRHPHLVSGTGAAEVLGFELQTACVTAADAEATIVQGAQVVVRLDCNLDADIEGAQILLQINDIAMNALVSLPLHGLDGRMLTITPGVHRLEVPIGPLDLNAGKYSFVVVIRELKSSMILARAQGLAPFRISAPTSHWGPIVRPVLPITATSERP